MPKENIKKNKLLKLSLSLLVFFLGCASLTSQDQKIADEMQELLKSNILDVWYPASIDTVNGGFLSDFSFDWKPAGPQNKMLVTQTRHVWTTSEMTMFLHEDKYRKIAEHGFQFLKDKMWDETYGGFYMLRNSKGEPTQRPSDDLKTAYSNAFAIYSLSTYYEMSSDTSALNLARKTFLWLDKHSHDPEFKGYFDLLTREGIWLYRQPSDMENGFVARCKWKDQNSSIHLLEALTQLYKVWPDRLVRERLLEMLGLIRDTITTEKGYLTLFLQRDWTPVSFRDSSDAVRKANANYDHVSFGHDVETAYLMLEASHALGLQHDVKTLTVAKRMVDHALANGWDKEHGGFYEAGYYYAGCDSISIIDKTKTWWVQAEGLNALLLMAKLFPDETKYYEAFRKQWEYIKKYLIDHEHGGWYHDGLDESPGAKHAAKASVWKINYHNSRTLMNCIKMLRSEHDLARKNDI